MPRCPKCGAEVEQRAVICPQCDYIVRIDFLDDGALERGTTHEHAAGPSSGSDAVLLGDLDEEVALLWSDAPATFLTADSRELDGEIAKAPVYVSLRLQELMRPDAVLAPAPDIDARKGTLSPFELHVLSLLDGRPLARLHTGLGGDELRAALGMLADKRAVVLVRLDEHATLQDDDPAITAPRTDPMPAGGEPTQEAPWHGSLGADALPPPANTEPDPAPAPASSTSTGAHPEVDPLMTTATTTTTTQPLLVVRPAMKARAAGFHVLAVAELERGNRARASVYAKLAATDEPEEARHRDLGARIAAAPAGAPAAGGAAALVADADAAERAGNHERALLLLKKAVKASPSSASAHNRLGILLAVRFRRFTQAAVALIRAVELDPHNSAFKNNLGKLIALAEERGPLDVDGLSGADLLRRLKRAFDLR